MKVYYFCFARTKHIKDFYIDVDYIKCNFVKYRTLRSIGPETTGFITSIARLMPIHITLKEVSSSLI